MSWLFCPVDQVNYPGRCRRAGPNIDEGDRYDDVSSTIFKMLSANTKAVWQEAYDFYGAKIAKQNLACFWANLLYRICVAPGIW